MNRKISYFILVIMCSVCLSACASAQSGTAATQKKEEVSTAAGISSQERSVSATAQTEAASTEKSYTLDFVDVYQNHYQTEILPEIPKHNYINDDFRHDGDKLYYENDSNYSSRLGVDVSEHQGNIDWQAVKTAGYDFAIIRIGYRGYGINSGNLYSDSNFDQNIQNAQAAGLDVGVYIFSQAINETEAQEEADLVLEKLKNYELQLPVVYDPETIRDDVARTDNVSGEQFTKNTLVFCDAVRKAGYQPMIYSNMLWEAFEFDLTRLTDIPIWYADYEDLPQTPYYFSIWQYTNEGQVNGISGVTDIDIELTPTNKQATDRK